MYLRPYLIIPTELFVVEHKGLSCAIVGTETVMLTDFVSLSLFNIQIVWILERHMSRVPGKQLGISIENSIWVLHYFQDTLDQELNLNLLSAARGGGHN